MSKGGTRPGAGRPRREIPAIRTNLSLSQETREMLALAGDGDMSRGAELLASLLASLLPLLLGVYTRESSEP